MSFSTKFKANDFRTTKKSWHSRGNIHDGRGGTRNLFWKRVDYGSHRNHIGHYWSYVGGGDRVEERYRRIKQLNQNADDRKNPGQNFTVYTKEDVIWNELRTRQVSKPFWVSLIIHSFEKKVRPVRSTTLEDYRRRLAMFKNVPQLLELHSKQSGRGGKWKHSKHCVIDNCLGIACGVILRWHVNRQW